MLPASRSSCDCQGVSLALKHRLGVRVCVQAQRVNARYLLQLVEAGRAEILDRVVAGSSPNGDT